MPEDTSQTTPNIDLLALLRQLLVDPAKVEFLTAFSKAMDHLKASDEARDGTLAGHIAELTAAFEQLQASSASQFDAQKGEVLSLIAKELAKWPQLVDAKLKPFSKRLDGITIPKEEDVVARVLEAANVPKASDILDAVEKDLPALAAAIRDGLELLQGDDRLDKSAIKGLEEFEKRIKTIETRPIGGGITGRDLFKDIDLSPQLDGVTKTFNIPAVWNIIGVALSSFPNVLRKGVDYTYTSQSVTFTSEIDAATSLQAGQTCVLTVVTG